jgi:hypothetical protein
MRHQLPKNLVRIIGSSDEMIGITFITPSEPWVELSRKQTICPRMKVASMLLQRRTSSSKRLVTERENLFLKGGLSFTLRIIEGLGTFKSKRRSVNVLFKFLRIGAG